eukprot:TRINITY_DN11085_c0_g1_i1.p1 TRINITY_DN11085_c0_g1~~TRINITY_DN11085_c0_g1_i1.p1  ORF type:complete len:314 (-),score=28.00 TRINITY_DN11085_c0_g1_i1:29-970(-)
MPAGAELVEEAPLVCWPILGVSGTAFAFCEHCLVPVDDTPEVRICGCGLRFCSEKCQRMATYHIPLCGKVSRLREWQAQRDPDCPITAEAIARCLAIVATDTATFRAQHGLSLDLAFVNAARPFSRLIAPPDHADFEGIQMKDYVAVMNELLGQSLHEDQAIRSALLCESSIRTVLGQLACNSQAIFVSPETTTPLSVPGPQTTTTASGQLVLRVALSGAAGAAGNSGRVVKGAGVFVLQSCFNHSCDPNSQVTWGPDHCIFMHTIRPVKAGDELTISYINTAAPFAERQRLLRSYWFTCGCPRCVAERDAPQ